MNNVPIIDPSTLTGEQRKKIKNEYLLNELWERFSSSTSESLWYSGRNLTLLWLFGDEFFTKGNNMNNKRIQEAATEARMASAETLTPFGIHSIDDAVSLTGIELTYDEVAESAFEKGAEWLMAQPLSERLTDDEIKRIKEIYEQTELDHCHLDEYNDWVVSDMLERLEELFGKDFFEKEE